MTKKTYIKPLLKSFLIEPMDFLAASPNPEPTGNAKGSISFSDDVTSGIMMKTVLGKRLVTLVKSGIKKRKR